MNTRTYSKAICGLLAAIVVCLGVTSSTTSHAAAIGQSGTTAVYTYNSLTGPVHFRVFTPAGYRKGDPVPLVVVTHGCNTTAAQMETSTAYDEVAAANDFVVLYPDNDDAVHPVKCWQWYLPTSWQRGEGDIATIVGMVHATMAMRSIDTNRVYEIGMSSGALITSDLGAAYPHLFAAIGIMAGGPYGLDTCVAGRGNPSDSATAAYDEEGDQARVMPFIVLNGDKDNVVSPVCDDQAVQQWLRTDNLVLSGHQNAPLHLSPAHVAANRVPGGRSYTVRRYSAPNGCPLGEHYVIAGMGHFWSGGSSDPKDAPFTDPKGVSAAKASWTFFSHFSQTASAIECGHPRAVAVAAVTGKPARASAPCAHLASRPWCNTSLSPDRRADLLEKQMTTDEKIGFLNGIASDHTGANAAIPRLGIPSVTYTDGPVGVHPAKGEATALPIPMALAATFDRSDAYRYGKLIASEAKHQGDDVVFGPTVNLMRTPENGRTYEAYGEDPFLDASTAVSWIDGAQSTGVLADIKHFAENNQEGQLGLAPLTSTAGTRILVDVNVSPRVMHENELLPFEAAVKMAHVATVMCAYNRVNGAFSCSNSYLLQRTLEQQWGFKGYVLSDYGAAHSTVGNLNHGLDFEPSFAVTIPSLSSYFAPEIQAALAAGLVKMSTIDGHVHRILRTWFAYGIFDRPPFRVSEALIDKRADAHTATQIEQNGAVLLKNAHHLLPLDAAKVDSIAIVGQYADRYVTGGGSGDVHPYSTVTDLQGIRHALRGHHTTIRYADGSSIPAAVAAAKASRYAVVVVGDVESEGQDKSCISLNCASDLTESVAPTNSYPCSIPDCPPNAGDETGLIKAVAAANPRTIVVLETGAPVLTDWRAKVPALLEAWYPGEHGGTAIANLLLGKAEPAGRLPATFPNSASQLPTAGNPAAYPGLGIEEYYDEGLDIGYRWYLAHHFTPAYPFGYGLSYTRFRFSDLLVTAHANASNDTVATVSVRVTNTGSRAGRAVPELYLALPSSEQVPEPPLQLRGYRGVRIPAGGSAVVSFPLNARSFAYYDAATDRWKVRQSGCFGVRVGSSVGSLPLRATLRRGHASCGPKAVPLQIRRGAPNNAAVLPSE